MFAFKVATFLAVAAATVLAIPTPNGSGSGQCSTGTLQCCNSIAPAGSTNNGTLNGLLPTYLSGTDIPLGLNCLPISVLGAGSAGTCNQQAACCSDVNNEGLVPIGLDCSPINVGL